MAISLSRGRRTTLAKVDVFADGVAVKTVGRETFRLCRELVDGVHSYIARIPDSEQIKLPQYVSLYLMVFKGLFETSLEL